MKSKLNIKTILIMAIIGVVSLIFFNKSFAANTAKVVVDGANIRSSADINSDLVEQASKGEQVEILEKSGEWYKVNYNGKTGYLRKDLLDVKDENATENTATGNTVQTSNTTEPQETTTTEVEQNTENESQTVATEKGETVVETTGIYTCKENAKLKIMPLINGNDIKEINQASKVNVLEVNNKWALVESESVRGWILVSKIEKENTVTTSQTATEETETEEQEEESKTEETTTEEQQPETTEQTQATYVEKTMYVNSEVINLRAGATTDSESLSRLTLATQVTVVGEENGWSKVKVEGTEGYILSTLLADRKPEVTTSRSSEEQRQEPTTNKKAETKKTSTEKATSSTGSATGASIVEKAKSYIGSKYVYGGSSPSGFDCSGFTQYIYKQFGINLNRTAAAQYSNGTSVSKSNLQLGDLVMFGSSASNIYHVGIYMGNGMMVHAANSSRGVTTDTINSGYYSTNYFGARRIVN